MTPPPHPQSLRSVHIAVPSDADCIFTNISSERHNQSVREADLTIRLVVKANSMSAKKIYSENIIYGRFMTI